MPTQRQIQANRRNASLSTGPQSPQGKAISAANAVTHGFSARNAVLPSESSEDYQALLHQFEDEFQPQTALEQSLLRQLADADWRLRRAACFEAAVLLVRVERVRRFTDKCPENLPDDPALSEICLLGDALINDAGASDPLSKLSRHEARLTRRYFKALAQLRKARRASQPRATADPPPSTAAAQSPALTKATTPKPSTTPKPKPSTTSNPATTPNPLTTSNPAATSNAARPSEPAPAPNSAAQPSPAPPCAAQKHKKVTKRTQSHN